MNSALGSRPFKAANAEREILALKRISRVKSGSSFVISLGSEMTLSSVQTQNILRASVKGLSVRVSSSSPQIILFVGQGPSLE